MKQTFGQVLKEIRRSRNISQRDLAEKVGVDFTYISKLENDRLLPPAVDTIIKLADVLSTPREVLLSISGKIDNEMKEIITQTPEAMKFLNEVREMKLTGKEWDKMFMNLKKLR